MSAVQQIDVTPARGWATPVRIRVGRHRAVADVRARPTLRRMFYFARHLRRR